MVDWRPRASQAALLERASVLAELRAFFAGKGVIEVETPLVARFGVTDPSIEPLQVQDELGGPHYLQTSPEYAMKRLLAAGSGAIYQLGKAFRGGGESGSRHNPEFTLLEWYRPEFTLDELIDEVGQLVAAVLRRGDWSQLSYAAAFEECLGLDPWQCDVAGLASVANAHIDTGDLSLTKDAWLDLLMSHCVEPMLASRGMVFIRDYPPSQAALAACRTCDGRLIAERFELYVDGVELANGYFELRDPQELVRRAELDNQERACAGMEQRDLDPRLVAALHEGLPECSGVALGVDRLLMLRLGATELSQVLAFDWSSA